MFRTHHINKKHHLSLLVLSLHLLAVGAGLFVYQNKLTAADCPNHGVTCRPLPSELDREDQILVKFKNRAGINKTLIATGHKELLTYKLNKLEWYLIKTDCKSDNCKTTHINKLKKDSNVEEAQEVIVYDALLTPNDPQYSQQWPLPKIKANLGWDITNGNSETVIAVIDTGFALTHQDLSPKIWSNGDEISGNGIDDDGNGYVDDTKGWDFVNNDNSPQAGQDCLVDSSQCAYAGHGTLTASVAAAATDNSKGIAGVNWNAKIMPVQVLADNGSGSTADVANGIIYAADNGAHSINLSLGSGSHDPALEDAIEYAASKKVSISAAAGNGGSEFIYYPARYSEVIAVGATESNDARASYSSYGNQLDVVAPGSSVRAAYWTRTSQTSAYAFAYGTSLATPHVAGLAGLIKGETFDLTTAQVHAQIRATADKVSGMSGNNFTKQYGYGRINVQKAIAPKITVTNMLLSKTSPLAGEDVVGTMTIRNDGGTPVFINQFGIAVRENDGSAINFGPELVGAELDPGESITSSKTNSFGDISGPHKYWGYFYTDAGGFRATNYKYFTAKAADQYITMTSPTLNPTPALTGIDITSSTTIRNNHPSIPLNIYTAGIASRDPDKMAVNFPSEPAFKLSPGESKDISKTRQFSKKGPYTKWAYFYFAGSGFRKSSVTSFNVSSPADNLVMTDWQHSNAAPIAGEDVAARLSVKNNNSASIEIVAGVAARDATAAVVNFPTETVTLNPGETKTINKTRFFSNVGSLSVWPYFYHAGQGYKLHKALSHTVKDPRTKLYVKSVTINPNSPDSDVVTATSIFKNTTAANVHLDNAGVAVRDSSGNAWNFPAVTGTILAPGETTITQTRSFTAGGTYSGWAYYYISGGSGYKPYVSSDALNLASNSISFVVD